MFSCVNSHRLISESSQVSTGTAQPLPEASNTWALSRTRPAFVREPDWGRFYFWLSGRFKLWLRGRFYFWLRMRRPRVILMRPAGRVTRLPWA